MLTSMTVLFLLVQVPAHPSDGGPIGAPARAGEVTFMNVSVETGLSGIRGNFFSWGDYNNDGYQDLLIDGRKLFGNSGPPGYVFIDQTVQAGIDAPVNSGVFGDFDNDGWLDIFCGGGRGSNDHPQYDDILWHNERDGTFRRVPVSDDVPHDTYPTVASGWADVDRDGFIDLYMVNYENASYQGYSDFFWTNDGDGTFTNATVSSNMSEHDHPYQGRGVSFCDFDNDGFQDAYVSNYRIMRNYLYHNTGFAGVMEEIAEKAGVEGHESYHPITRDGPYYGHSLGSSWGDMDNDGDMDLWVTNLAHKDVYRGPICDDSYLFENQGEEGGWTFRDVRAESGIPVKPLAGMITEGDELMVSSALADYDNDGDLDLFIPQIYGNIDYAYSYLFRNEGDMTFREVGDEAGLRVFNTYGSAWCDYDQDGWIDLVTGGGNWNASSGKTENYQVHLFRNLGGDTAPDRHWLELKLVGRESNAAAIGARVHVEADMDGDGEAELRMMRDVSGGTAAHGQQDSMVLHFGLFDVKGKVDVHVEWPMGRDTYLEDVDIDDILELFEPMNPLEMELEIADVSEDNGDARVLCAVNNTSEQEIDHLELSILYGYLGGTEERSVIVKDIPPYSPETLEVIADAPPFEGLQWVNVVYDASYPPFSPEGSEPFMVSPETNIPPVPVLELPEEMEENREVLIDGSGSYDPDGEIVSWIFDFGDGTGTGWTDENLVSHTYSEPGDYTVTLDVMDDGGLDSPEPASKVIRILPDESDLPVARIVSITPDEAAEGETVEFVGEGTPSPGERIEEYEWRSSLDGILSRRSGFEDNGLSPGEHEISFRVRDSSGRWSLPDISTLFIRSEEKEMPWVLVDPLPEGDLPRGKILVTGTAGPEGSLEYVEIRIDSGVWRYARGGSVWEYEMDTTGMESGREHSLQARAFADGYYSDIVEVRFTVESEGEQRTVTTGGGGSAPFPGPPVTSVYRGADDVTTGGGESAPFSGMWMWMAGVILIVLLLIAVYFAFILFGRRSGLSSKSGMAVRVPPTLMEELPPDHPGIEEESELKAGNLLMVEGEIHSSGSTR